MGLAISADKSAGYSTAVMTESDGSYSFNSLPSGVYKFTVTYPDTVVQTIDNYAVSPSAKFFICLYRVTEILMKYGDLRTARLSLQISVM